MIYMRVYALQTYLIKQNKNKNKNYFELCKD